MIKNMIKNICIVGAFGFDDLENATGGQPVKTRELYYGLNEKYGKERVSFVETYQWKKKPLKVLWRLMRNIPKSDRIIMLPAHNGLKVFLVLLQMLKNRKARLYYDVIGGWLPQIAERDSKLLKRLGKLDGIWVETNSMRDALYKLGLQKVTVVPNFKKLDPLRPEQLSSNLEKPYRVCTFSRVMEEKGIEDAINAVKFINVKYNEIVFQLDIYGKIDPGYEKRFRDIIVQLPTYIRYCGMVEPEHSVEVVKNYFALLFPTHYATEGIPGTVIDAYCAGVPVITALWENSADIFVEGVTGWGYPFGDQHGLTALLERILREPDNFSSMKTTTLYAAKKYLPDTAIERIEKFIDD